MPDQNPKPNQSMAEDDKTRAMPDLSEDGGADSGLDLHGGLGKSLERSEQKAKQSDSGEITGAGGQGLKDTVSLAHKTLAGGKYQVNEELGRGGMSVVYSATDLTLGRLVAVKVLLAEYALTVGPEAAMRFQQEARSVAKLSHPHIISIYEYGLLEDGAPFIVMDYIVGASLSDEMEAHGLMSEDRVLEIVKQSAEALRHSHAQGVVHRDIKPSNLLLTKGDDGEDYVRVVDFGIAKMQTQDSTGKLTRTGQVFGSPLYMSPEQCEGLVADARSDIYSLGCVAYELITGRPPHVGKNVVETMHRKMTSDPTPFALGAEHYNKNKKSTGSKAEDKGQFKLAFQKIILKMLASDPAKRYQNADQLLIEIKQLKGLALEKKPDNGRSLPALIPERGAWSSKKTALSASIVIGVAALFYINGHHPTPVTPASPSAVAPAPAAAMTTAPAQSATAVAVSSFEMNNAPTTVKSFPPALSGNETIFKKGFFVSNLRHWKVMESAGQKAFQSGDLINARKYFAAGLPEVDRLQGPEKKLALDVSLSDAIDLAQAQGNVRADGQLWQDYQTMIEARRQAISSIDSPLLTALDVELLSLRNGDSEPPEKLKRLFDRTFDRIGEEFADERFGDIERLLKGVIPLLQLRPKHDGFMARAYHTMASLRAIEGKWREALKYANLACGASQGSDQVLQANLAQALFFKGWAESAIGDSPEASYREALDLDAKFGATYNISRLQIWRKLAQYYESSKQTEQARACAVSGIKLAEEGSFAEKFEARRLEDLAFYLCVLGRSGAAIENAIKGLKIEDCTLPRQDYKVKEELRGLARYYQQNNQADLAQAARARADAIEFRLSNLDQIYRPSPL